MKGYQAGKNSMGLYAIKLHYSADPDHDVDNPNPDIAKSAYEWVETQRMQYPDPNDFQRELEISFYVAKGSRVFPQYSSVRHEMPLQVSSRKIVYRGWDFGWHAPVCLFAQIDAQGRLCVIRELVGSKQTTRDFATTVVTKSAEWFPLHTPGFYDYCDPAGQQVKSIDSDKNENRDIDVLHGLGIHPTYEWGWSRKDGRALIHQLLAVRTDSTPSMYVDPSTCPVLSEAALGRYVYPETQAGKLREEPNDEEHPFGDVMAALRYLVTGLHAKLALTRFKASSLAPQSTTARPSGYGMARR